MATHCYKKVQTDVIPKGFSRIQKFPRISSKIAVILQRIRMHKTFTN